MRSVGTGFVVALLGGCSVLNSFDEVQPAVSKTDSSTGTGGNTSDGGSGNETGGSEGTGGASTGGGGTGGADASVGGGGAGTGGGQAGGTGTGGVVNEGGADVFNPDQPVGVLVAQSLTRDLVVINVETGRLLSSEPMGSVRGIINDGLTNLWYIFEQGATPADPITLHARELDPGTGAWRERGRTTGLPAPIGRLGVLNRRLAYTSDNAGAAALTVVDTTDPANVRAVGAPRRPLPPGIGAAVLTTVTSTTVPGGVVNVIFTARAADCTAGADGGTLCGVTMVHFTVDATNVTSSGTPLVVGQVSSNGEVAAVSDPGVNNASEVVALPIVTNAQTGCVTNLANLTEMGSIHKLNPQTLAARQAPVTFPFGSEKIRGAAFDNCRNTIFLSTSINDSGVFAVPLDGGGTPFRTCADQGGQVVFEPYTRTLLRVRTTGGMEAYRVEGTRLAPTLRSVGNALPANFNATSFAVRYPPPCN